MAYGLSIQSFVKVIDSKGKESTINFNHPLNTDLGALKGTIRSTAALIDAVIRGQVIGAGITLVVNLADNLDIKESPILGSDIEEGVRMAFEAASGGVSTFRIPTINEFWLNSAGVLNTTAGNAVDDFVQLVIDGSGGLSNARPSDAYGSDLVAFINGQESFTASRG